MIYLKSFIEALVEVQKLFGEVKIILYFIGKFGLHFSKDT